jgi:hypothetical protein
MSIDGNHFEVLSPQRRPEFRTLEQLDFYRRGIVLKKSSIFF